jgi:hypothetical protein
LPRDEAACAVLSAFEARLGRLRSAPLCPMDDWQQMRFALEELRIGLFAEPLGTRGKVSPQRIERELLLLERGAGLI